MFCGSSEASLVRMHLMFMVSSGRSSTDDSPVSLALTTMVAARFLLIDGMSGMVMAAPLVPSSWNMAKNLRSERASSFTD